MFEEYIVSANFEVGSIDRSLVEHGPHKSK